ncbi:F0F1 ATP synthase subunit delta [Bacteroidaceae bacterium HV4-6-C5C]|jgi:ATP synthase, F1 delta subunit|nr:F0F1 ATP synthase subunit delta [Bacteroidaceae bacterium HV4-6-C5C]
MDIGIVSMRYAKALIQYAKDTGTEEKLYNEIRSLERSFRLHAELRLALENPVLSVKEKCSLISTASVGNDEPSQEFSRFISLVLKKRRENILHYICIGFLELYRKANNIGVGRLITAVPVNEDVRKRIRESASSMLHAQMELQTEVDPSIEGGFIFDINDFRLDASIATQLRRVKKQFIDKNRRIV